jgi:hypothetical protein
MNMSSRARTAFLALAIGGALAWPAAAQPSPAAHGAHAGAQLAIEAEAQFEAEPEPDPVAAPTPATAEVIRWVLASRDNGDRPFIVIDKVAAALFVFDASGMPIGAAPALLGIASGDDSTPGIGDRALSEIGPAERTTPAGRFVARFGPAYGGRTVLWVDFATSVAIHPVVSGTPRERRLQRLESRSPEDNRITFGCINVPVPFYRDVLQPLFGEAGGIVYILPETRPFEEVFPRMRLAASAPPGLAPDKPPVTRTTSFSLGR